MKPLLNLSQVLITRIPTHIEVQHFYLIIFLFNNILTKRGIFYENHYRSDLYAHIF